ncbi:MAG: hypothetical protein J5806_14215 [Lentisphaeria bacterium]|nr:hypothetical protein [Lentisphaeria bacterium]
MAKTLNVTGKRELLIDDYLIEERSGLQFRLHEPVEVPCETKPGGAYVTVLQLEDGRYRMYYRGFDGVYEGPRSNGNPGEFVGVSESEDGLTWREPELNLFPGRPVPPGTIFYQNGGFTHNFVPFLDRNPACPPEARYKAVAGVRETGGLFSFHSADGLHWEMDDASRPLIPYTQENKAKYGNHLLDSQNVVFYSEYEQCYVMYFRVWKTADGRTGLRSFAKTVSQDFLHWSEPELLDPNRPEEHLYVSTLAPYFRAPEYYVGVGTRFFGARGAATDMTLLFARHGQGIQRPFPGVWLAPGLDPERWGNRMNYMAWGLIPTSPEELSFYHGHKPIRCKLRTDGFVSLSAGLETGSFLTRPLQCDGGGLELNLATSAGGGFRLEVCDVSGQPLPGYSFADFDLFFGDRIAFEPAWHGKTFAELLPGEFRLRAEMTECDLYSIAFPQG